MEKVIECPHCNDTDRCFEDIQDTFSSFMCFNCGYMSHSGYTEDKISEIQHTSQLIRDLHLKMMTEIFIGIQVLSTWES